MGSQSIQKLYSTPTHTNILKETTTMLRELAAGTRKEGWGVRRVQGRSCRLTVRWRAPERNTILIAMSTKSYTRNWT